MKSLGAPGRRARRRAERCRCDVVGSRVPFPDKVETEYMIARKWKNRKARLEVRHAIRKSSEGARRLPEFVVGVLGLTLFFSTQHTKKHIANDHHRPTMENIKQCQQIGSSNSKKNIEEPGSQPEACGKKIKETENLAEGGAGKTPGGNWKQFKTVRMRAKGREVVRN